MSGSRGVACSACGASTPLPEDLRVPSFTCAYCQATLETAAYASAAASADALVAHIRTAVESPGHAGPVPRLENASKETRQSNCVRCGSPITIPLALGVREIRCEACGHTQPVREHVPDRERFGLELARQSAGNHELRALIAAGVPCSSCGATNTFPDDGRIQMQCAHCGATVLLSDHADATAVARHRLKHGLVAARADMQKARGHRDRYILLGVAVLLVLFAVGFWALGGFSASH